MCLCLCDREDHICTSADAARAQTGKLSGTVEPFKFYAKSHSRANFNCATPHSEVQNTRSSRAAYCMMRHFHSTRKRTRASLWFLYQQIAVIGRRGRVPQRNDGDTHSRTHIEPASQTVRRTDCVRPFSFPLSACARSHALSPKNFGSAAARLHANIA